MGSPSREEFEPIIESGTPQFQTILVLVLFPQNQFFFAGTRFAGVFRKSKVV
jgi:hypothetical protein